MQHKDRKLMEDICAYSERFVLLNKRSPYKSEIASEFGVAKSTVTRYLSFMSEKGMIAYDGRNIQTKASAKATSAALWPQSLAPSAADLRKKNRNRWKRISRFLMQSSAAASFIFSEPRVIRW